MRVLTDISFPNWSKLSLMGPIRNSESSLNFYISGIQRVYLICNTRGPDKERPLELAEHRLARRAARKSEMALD
jgi:hypothetical protein